MNSRLQSWKCFPAWWARAWIWTRSRNSSPIWTSTTCLNKLESKPWMSRTTIIKKTTTLNSLLRTHWPICSTLASLSVCLPINSTKMNYRSMKMNKKTLLLMNVILKSINYSSAYWVWTKYWYFWLKLETAERNKIWMLKVWRSRSNSWLCRCTKIILSFPQSVVYSRSW